MACFPFLVLLVGEKQPEMLQTRVLLTTVSARLDVCFSQKSVFLFFTSLQPFVLGHSGATTAACCVIHAGLPQPECGVQRVPGAPLVPHNYRNSTVCGDNERRGFHNMSLVTLIKTVVLGVASWLPPLTWSSRLEANFVFCKSAYVYAVEHSLIEVVSLLLLQVGVVFSGLVLRYSSISLE